MSKLGGDEDEHLVQGIGGKIWVLAVQQKTRDHRADNDNGAETDQRTETERGGTARRSILFQPTFGDGEHAQKCVQASAWPLVGQRL